MRIKLVILSSVLLASCSHLSTPGLGFLRPYKIDIQQGNLITPEMREKVQLGMSSAMVRSILGTPLISDSFHANRWDYVYSLEKDGEQAGKQRLTLYFKDEHLMRIDDSHMPTEPVPASQTEKKQESQ